MKVLVLLPPEDLPGVRVYRDFEESGYKPGDTPVSNLPDSPPHALNLTGLNATQPSSQATPTLKQIPVGSWSPPGQALPGHGANEAETEL